jgi:hypothetical protein
MDIESIAEKVDTCQETQTSHRSYSSLADYAQQQGAPIEAFIAAGWRGTVHKGRPALEYDTATGKRWRYLDGLEPRHDSPPGYKACWYGLERAQAIAAATGQALILVNGAPAVVAAQYYDLPAFALSAGESWDIPDALIDELKAAGVTEIIIALDCDETGRRSAAKRARQFIEAGIIARAVDLALPDGGDFADFRKLHGEQTLNRLAQLPEIPPAEPTRPVIQYSGVGGDRRDEYERTIVTPAFERAATEWKGKKFLCINPDHHEKNASAYIRQGRIGTLYQCNCGTFRLTTVGRWLGVVSYREWLRETYPGESRRKAKRPAAPIRQRHTATGPNTDAKAVQYVSEDLTPAALASAGDVLIIAPVGMGKTCAVADHVNELPAGTKFTYLAQFQLLVQAGAQVINHIHHYEDAADKWQSALGIVERLATSVSSLHKFNRRGGKVTVDEGEGVLDFVTNSGTFRDSQMVTSYREFKAIVRSADQLIIMDANASDILIHWLAQQGRRVTVKRYTHGKSRGKVTLLRGKTDAFYTVDKLLRKASGQIIYVACSSEATASELAERCPGYRVLKITKDTSKTPLVQTAIKDPEARKQYDLIVYSPAAGAGVDFSESAYAHVAIFDRTPLAPEHGLQLFGRVRNARRYYAAVPAESNGYPTPTADELLADLIRRETWTAQQTGQLPAISGDYLEIARLWSLFTERRLRESARWRHYFIQRLQANGYAVQANNARAPQAYSETLKNWRQERKDNQWAYILSAVDQALSDETIDGLRMRGVEITTEHRLQNTRYKIERALGHMGVTDQDRDLVDPRGRKRLFRLADLFADESELLTADQDEASAGRPIQKRRYRTLNLKVFSKLLTLAGLKGAPESQFLSFVEYFQTERSAPDVCERFAAFNTPDALRLFEALGHHGNNARTIPGLCRWLVEYFGLKLTSHQRREETGRAMFYQVDANTLAYRLDRARRAAALRGENLSKNVLNKANNTFLDTTPNCHKSPPEGWREVDISHIHPRKWGDISHLPTFGGKSKFNPFSRPESEAA